jgi:hypothetical protein
MSWRATAHIKLLTHMPDGSRLRAAEKLLLFVLADSHNEERGKAWPSMPTLARQSLLSERQTKRLIRRLESNRVLQNSLFGILNARN